MSNYDKLKNDDLKKILTERGLPTTGKKADFVARLTEHEAKQSSIKASDSANKSSPDKPSAKPDTKQNPTATTAPEISKDGPTTTTHNNAMATNDTTADTSSSTPSKEQIKSNDDREAKLAARAARFGLPKDEEEERRKTRAARFGIEQKDATTSTAPEDKPLSQPKAKKTSEKKEPSTSTAAAKSTANKGAETQKRKVSVLDDPVEAEKARKRALKFGTAPPTTSTTQETSKAPAAGIASTS